MVVVVGGGSGRGGSGGGGVCFSCRETVGEKTRRGRKKWSVFGLKLRGVAEADAGHNNLTSPTTVGGGGHRSAIGGEDRCRPQVDRPPLHVFLRDGARHCHAESGIGS